MQKALVTGANAGIGLATAKGLAQRGMHVLLLCRNAGRGAEALQTIRSAGGSAELLLCDLADPHAVANVSETLQARDIQLDVLINNAGLYAPERVETPEGLELTFAVNHLGAYRLTRVLLPRMTDQGRVIFLSSRSHREGRIDLEDLQRSRRYWHGYLAYSDSKLCSLLTARALARRQERVSVYAVHPGVVATEFAQDSPGFLNRLFRIAKPLFLTPEQGSDTVVWLATVDTVPGESGTYWVKRSIVTPSARALDDETAQALWDVSEVLAGPLPPVS